MKICGSKNFGKSCTDKIKEQYFFSHSVKENDPGFDGSNKASNSFCRTLSPNGHYLVPAMAVISYRRTGRTL